MGPIKARKFVKRRMNHLFIAIEVPHSPGCHHVWHCMSKPEEHHPARRRDKCRREAARNSIETASAKSSPKPSLVPRQLLTNKPISYL